MLTSAPRHLDALHHQAVVNCILLQAAQDTVCMLWLQLDSLCMSFAPVLLLYGMVSDMLLLKLLLAIARLHHVACKCRIRTLLLDGLLCCSVVDWEIELSGW